MVRPFTLNNFADEHEEIEDEEVKGNDHGFVAFFEYSSSRDVDNQVDINTEEIEDTPDITEDITEEITEVEDRAADIENEARKIFEDAYIQGEKAGHEMGMKKVEPLIKRLNGDIAALSVFKKDFLEKAEKLSVELALVFAEAIVLKECKEDRDIVMNMAKKAMEICEEKSGITIRMRREDARLISEESIYPLKVIPDDTLKDPGFIIETNFGDIDGTITTQIDELKKEFCSGYADR